MKLVLSGHDCKYAVEQIMLMMFPNERPEYEDKVPRQGNYAKVTVFENETSRTAHVRLREDGKTAAAQCSRPKNRAENELAKESELQKIIKLAFFRAAVKLTRKKPVWGALTGIRPAKLISQMKERGMTEEEAARRMIKEFYVSPNRTNLCLSASRAGDMAKAGLGKRDVALYVGIPFCPTRCAYCSFVSQTVEKSMSLICPFLDVLKEEIAATAETVKKLGLRVISVYIGGGTPTTLSGEQLTELIGCLRRHFDWTDVSDFTVEAGRPDTITRDRMEALKAGGVNRISINPQTMEDSVLKAIGRRHTAADILSAYALARKVGFNCINMDLIAGLPADTAEGFYRTLDQVLSLEPENITVHTLSLKKGARIMLEGTALPGEEEVARMLDYAAAKLPAAEYAPYYLYRQKFMSGGFENVGWSKPGTDNLYNILIMEELCTILAMGGGGSTKLVAPEKGRIERIFNAKYPQEYIEHREKMLSSGKKVEEFYREEMPELFE